MHSGNLRPAWQPSDENEMASPYACDTATNALSRLARIFQASFLLLATANLFGCTETTVVVEGLNVR